MSFAGAVPATILLFYIEGVLGAGKQSGYYLALYFLGGALGIFDVCGFFLLRDGGRHLWECTVAFNRAYAGSNTFALTQFWFRLR